MPARLIINADDFGLTPGINRAILELHVAGVLRSTSLMASGAAFDEAAAMARAHPHLGVGCHLVFVDGVPICPPESVPTLLGPDGKRFRTSLLDFAQAALRGAIKPNELARETQAQIERLQHAEIAVTHVDTHKHTHLFPAVARTVLEAARRCGVACFRNPFEPRWAREFSRSSASFFRAVQWELLDGFSDSFRRRIAPGGLTTEGTLGVLATGALTPDLLRLYLRELGIVEQLREPRRDTLFELCVHPGYADAALDAIPTRLRASREREVTALATVIPEFVLRPDGPQLIHYGQLHRK